ncbi:MAG: 4-hydroxy-tetrahydrodipicolinate synthase [Nitrospira sp. HN-bin3]|jgi:4-hydroxy-tetrahydrodipicolinate synthase|uniref:4-hydroxy-tetrahydrodipicolinate synthase n=1 Tax=Nitrospira cf. moscoviensis SBR1015 TaxID=96242 RepID=UPI000A0C8AF5|nr:4-hydroxy-tetrahydrodipicolinate synthase [Nitrospira cf. moscoviensis SBR1015]MBH0208419.1 4-hydroxy-tetrahydrodipicolinate synthase [Nitrospira sp.]OQW37463.1 MAG: 4-hydroxy-tetrahydrodipicolinate synthase [Nitrospira sp. HN-bin3]
MFTGSLVAIVTPFRKGKVDERALADLIEWQIANGTNGIVPCGTTGESATLSHDEHNRVIELTVEVVRRRVPVVAGTGSNSTDEAIALTKHAKQAGADAALLITPYYNKPTQEGLYRHYRAVAEAVDLPLVLYNIPGRTGVNMLPATIARLTTLPTIVGVKEGSGSVQQASDLVLMCGDRITVLAGDDALTLPMMAVGGKGVITVTANIVPADMAALVKAFSAGRIEEARRIHFKLSPLFAALFFETNPIPVKEALGLMGKIDPELRLPLCPMAQETREKLVQVLKDVSLITRS